MKLCPQCEFIYEDDQNLCDMDGEFLEYDTRVGVVPVTLPVAISARPAKSRLRIIALPVVAGLLLSALLFIAYCASSPLLYSNASPIRKSEAPETDLQRQLAPTAENSPPQPGNPSQSPTDVASESVNTSADDSTGKPAPEPAIRERFRKGNDGAPKVNDNRLTISRALPTLPQIAPLPHLPSPKRLPLAQAASAPGSNQKALVVDVKPAPGRAGKRSRVGTFLKKTARAIKKPFKL